MLKPSLRHIWLTAHRWVALVAGCALLVAALTGVALLLGKPLDERAHPELFLAGGDPTHRAARPDAAIGNPTPPYRADDRPAVPDRILPSSGGAASLESVRQRLRAEFGPDAVLTLRPPRGPGNTLWVLVRGNWSGTLYIDPRTGREQGRRGADQGWFNLVFKLHSALLLGPTGKALLALAALAYLILLVSGLVLWWPARWPPTLRVEWRRGLLRGLFDLHRMTGVLLGLLIAIPVASGAWMAWRPLGSALNAIVGSHAAAPPVIDVSGAQDAASIAMANLDDIVRDVGTALAGQAIGYIQLPNRLDRPIRVRMRLEADPHPNGLTSVWVHPLTGKILAIRPWNAGDASTHATSYVYPLHIGELGGPAQYIATAILGGGLATIAVSGLWLWWRRRPARRAASPRARLAS